MSPRPIRFQHLGQEYSIDYDDSEEFDIDFVQAQIYSMTDIEPIMQHFEPELKLQNLDQVLKLSKRGSEPEIDPEIVLSSIEWQSACSRIWLGDVPTVQPSAVSGDTRLCIVCASSCYAQRGAALSPNTQSAQGFVCQCQDCLFQPRVSARNEILAEPFRDYLVKALKHHQTRQDEAMIAKGHSEFTARLQSNMRQIADFENAENQRRALAVIPLQELIERGKARGADGFHPQDELVFQLLNWFKNEFFQWVNSPPCERCGKETAATGHSGPTPDERRFGAGIVELHQCRTCQHTTRFPRYNHSGKLMETRRGRCGEWAQAFVLCCRALKFSTRFVVDWTDHVWAEVYSEAKRRWVHCDPCENRYDAPLLYEEGWGKKLTYVIAFSNDEVRDVTRRYTKKFQDEVLPRRRSCQEAWLAATLQKINQAMRMRMLPRASFIEKRWSVERSQLDSGTLPAENKQPLTGRQTGTVEWRRARGELGQSAAQQSADGSGSQASETQSSKAENLSKSQLQDLVKAYFLQMTKGCGRSDCHNVEFCAAAKDSTLKSCSHKELLSRSIIIVRDWLDSKLCSNIDPVHPSQ